MKVKLRIIKLSREAIPFELNRVAAKGWPCPYCWTIMDARDRRKRPTMDHVIPKSRGGTGAGGNLLPVCARCNADKGNLLLTELQGLWMAMDDPRASKVAQLFEWISEDWEESLRSAVAAEVGAAYAKAKRGLLKSSTTVHSAEQRAWFVMDRLKIPKTHWTFVAPNKVRVLLGPFIETFHIKPELELSISNHPRFKFVRPS